jgi:hypothetical protein
MSGELSGNVNRDDKDCHNAQLLFEDVAATSLGTSIPEAGSKEIAHLDI